MTQKQKKLIHEAEQLLHNARTDPGMAEAMQARGYDQDSWAQGRELVEAAKAGARAREAAYSAQLGATDTFKHQYDETWDQSQTLAHVCIALFQGQAERLRLLGLHQRRRDNNGTSEISRPRKQSPLNIVVAWKRNLFEVAQSHAEIAPRVAAHGFPAEPLAQGAAAVEAVVEANHVQERAKDQARLSRIERDRAFEELRIWYRCVQKVVRLAMRDRRSGSVVGPQL
jgi:hypothetical protein